MTEWRIAPRIRSVSLSPVIWYAGFRPTCGYPLMMRIKNVDEGAALMLASALMQALCFRVAVNLKYPELPRPDHEVRLWCTCELTKELTYYFTLPGGFSRTGLLDVVCATCCTVVQPNVRAFVLLYILLCYLCYSHSSHSVRGWYIQNSVAHVTHGYVLAYCSMLIQFKNK